MKNNVGTIGTWAVCALILLLCYCGFYVLKARECLLEKGAFSSSVPVNRQLQEFFSVVYAPAIRLDTWATGRDFPVRYTGEMPP